ncbi:MAG: ribonuclease D [Methylococcaceae bacterium]
MKNPPVRFIDSLEPLKQFISAIQGSEWLALDTEFLRDKTYFPRFCLLQIASENQQVACIDPLSLPTLEPLEALLYDARILKVFHAGRQDLEIFYHLWGKLPGPVFDTQIAAPLLGMAEQISYAGLVSTVLGVNLSKSHTRTDWSLRPLSESQIRYAADDVIYLATAYLKLRDKLQHLGRHEWLQPEFDLLMQPSLYENSPEHAWQKVSGVAQLKDGAMLIIRSLAAWRECQAREENVPRNWIIKDELLINLARIKPSSMDDFRLIRGLDERLLKRHGETILRLIQQPPSTGSISETKNRGTRKTPSQEAVLDLLSAVVRLNAEQHAMSPSMLASRKDLEQFLDTPEDSKLLDGWRKAMIGEELMAVIHSDVDLRIQDGKVIKVGRCG